MTISNNYVPVKQLGNGVTTVFTGLWNMLNASFCRVYLENVTTGIQTPQTLGADYTLSFTSSGFTVTFFAAPSSSNYVVIGRDVSQDQTVPYTTSKGFQGAVEENSFDKLTAMLQDLSDAVDRSFKFQLGDSSSGTLPASSVRANKYLGFDSTGAPVALPSSTAIAGNPLFVDAGWAFLNETSTGMYRAGAGDMRVKILGIDSAKFNTKGLQIDSQQVSADPYGNRIVNGDFLFDFRMGGAAKLINSGSIIKAQECWWGFANGGGTFNMTRVTGFRQANCPRTDTALRIDVVTPDATLGATDNYHFGQAIEGNMLRSHGWGTPNAKPCTLSFVWADLIAGSHLIGGSIRNRSTTWSFPFQWTQNAGSSVAQKVEITIPAQTLGTWDTDNGIGLYLTFNLGCGSSVQSTANAWNTGNFLGSPTNTNLMTASNSIWITEVKFQEGSVATPFDVPAYNEAWNRVKRYWNFFINGASGNGTPIGQCASTTGAVIYYPFDVEMRIAPNAVYGAAASYSITGAAGANIACTAISTQASGTRGIAVAQSVAAGLVAGDATRATVGTVFVDAELV